MGDISPSRRHRAIRDAIPAPQDELNSILKRVQLEASIELPSIDKHWTPSKSQRTVADKIHGHIKFLFYQNRKALDAFVDSLKSEVRQWPDADERRTWVLEQMSVLSAPTKSSFSKNLNEALQNAKQADGGSQPSAPTIPSIFNRQGPVTRSVSNGTMSSFVTRSSTSFASDRSDGDVSKPTTAQTSFQSTFQTSFGAQGNGAESSFSRRQSLQERHLNDGDGMGKGAKRERSAHELHDIDTARATASFGHDECDKRRKTDHHRLSTNDQLTQRDSTDGVEQDMPQSVQHQIKAFPETGFGRLVKCEGTKDFWKPRFGLRRGYGSSSKAASEAWPIDNTMHFYQILSELESRGSYSKPRLDGRMIFNKSNRGPLLDTMLQVVESQQTCRIQRRFGWHRVMFIDLPLSRVSMPPSIKGQKQNLDRQLLEWLIKPHQLLERTWRAFHLQQNQQKRRLKETRSEPQTHRVVFFATHGRGIDEVDFVDLVNWMFPIHSNLKQPICKAFARFDLIVSGTTPTIKFTAEQILNVDDDLPTTVSEFDKFADDDHKFEGMTRRKHDAKEAMTDGCGRISVGAAKLICQKLELTTRPTAFQARVFGAKGLWFISGPYETSDEHDLGVWIEIRQSQSKVQHDNARVNDDPTLGSFDVVKWSCRAKAATIHRDYVAILEDRGVPRDTIKEFAEEQFKVDMDAMLQAAKDPVELMLFRTQHSSKAPSSALKGKSGLPRDDRGILEALVDGGGFMPTQCYYLATVFKRMCNIYLYDLRQQFRVSCPNSTTLFGITDPVGVLQPGQVHVCFSEPFTNESKGSLEGESFASLAGMTALLARDPALRGSDIQKVDCVYHSELAHLTDVVVFPSTGSMPMAAKLQGGDYDGDIFWICWERKLTGPFRNAPVLQPEPISHFDIKQEARRLEDLATNEIVPGSKTHCEDWLRAAFDHKIQDSMLGTATIYYYKLAYQRGGLWHSDARMLADLHEHLIDAAKNGYSFSQSDFERFLDSQGLPSRSKVPTPGYDQKPAALKSDWTGEDKPDYMQLLNFIQEGKKFKAEHILDDILFNVIDPCIEKALHELTIILDGAKVQDSDLEAPIEALRTLRNQVRPDIRGDGDITDVCRELKGVFELWVRAWRLGDTPDRTAALHKCCQQYNDIPPPEWARPWLGIQTTKHGFKEWDLMKAGILAKTFPSQGSPMRNFWLARGPLCYIKANTDKGEKVVQEIRNVLRPQRRKDIKSKAEAEHQMRRFILQSQHDDADEEVDHDDGIDHGNNESDENNGLDDDNQGNDNEDLDDSLASSAFERFG